MPDSVFTKIINGDIPCHKIYEDEHTFAFLDNHPSQLGHTLVVPKKQVESLWELSEPDYQAVMETVKKVARRLKEVLGIKYVGMEVIGVDVPHAHVHVIPFNTTAEFKGESNRPDPDDHQTWSGVASKLAF